MRGLKTEIGGSWGNRLFFRAGKRNATLGKGGGEGLGRNWTVDIRQRREIGKTGKKPVGQEEWGGGKKGSGGKGGCCETHITWEK